MNGLTPEELAEIRDKILPHADLIDDSMQDRAANRRVWRRSKGLVIGFVGFSGAALVLKEQIGRLLSWLAQSGGTP